MGFAIIILFMGLMSMATLSAAAVALYYLGLHIFHVTKRSRWRGFAYIAATLTVFGFFYNLVFA